MQYNSNSYILEAYQYYVYFVYFPRPGKYHTFTLWNLV